MRKQNYEGELKMIHTVTTFEKITKIERDSKGIYILPFPEFGKIHCAGYYTSVEDAINFMNANSEILHDTTNDYCIIEEYDEGLFSTTKNRYLYKWNNNRFEQIDEPISLNKVTNFAMG